MTPSASAHSSPERDQRSRQSFGELFPKSAAEFALEGGKYQIVSRDAAQLAEESARVIGGHLARPGQLVKQGSLA